MANESEEKKDPAKRGYTLYLKIAVIERLEKHCSDPEVDRSPSWFVGRMLEENLGMRGHDGEVDR